MFDRPPFHFRVRAPIIAPIQATAGAILSVWPGHPTHTLAVYDPAAKRVLRHRYVEDGALYGPLLILDADGLLESLTPAVWQQQRTA